MTYNSRKLLHGQEFVEEIEIQCNACRYTQGEYIGSKQRISTTFPYSDSFTGTLSLTSFQAGWSTLWAAVPGEKYVAVPNGEIIRVSITAGIDASIGIVERGMFGTEPENLSGPMKIIHDGEADNSCRGFSQTCSNSQSFDADAIKSLRFCTGQRVAGEFIFPGLFHQKIRHDSAEVDPGESIGGRARLRGSISDFVDDDLYVVPYSDKRSSSGTFFGKLLARNPYLDGRKIIHRYGLRDVGSYEEPDWVEHEFIIDTFRVSKGVFEFSALDPIILTEDKKAKMPVLSPAVLEFSITGTPATFTYLDAPDYYFGALSSAIIVRIDSEVIRCTVSNAKELTVVERGYRSVAKDHEAGATIQDCIRLQNTHVVDAIVFAIETYTRVPATYIGDYSAAIASNPTAEIDDGLITKPYPVVDFINEMIRLGNLIFKYDEDAKLIAIDHIAETDVQPIAISGADNIKRDSIDIDFNQKNQFTRFSMLWHPADITKDAEENYQIGYLAIDLDVESEDKLGQQNEKKQIKSMLLNGSTGDSLLATSYCARAIQSSSSYPKIANFTLDAKDVGTNGDGVLSPGSIVNLNTQESQDIDGNSITELYQILKISGDSFDGFKIKAKKYQAIAPGDIDFTISDSKENYDLSVDFSPVAGNYTVYIEPGVVIGSNDTSIPAFTTGMQDPGVSFRIINRGSILGMGGNGGDCQISAGPSTSAQQSGLPGGAAFEATVDCEIDCGAGLIWAGGGGAGGQNMGSLTGPLFTAALGGGGGQGYGTAISGHYSTGGTNPDFLGFSERGDPGNQAAPGETGGGAWGEDGATLDFTDPAPIAVGGIAGEAIKSNGNTVTITAGNNDFNIRGRRT